MFKVCISHCNLEVANSVYNVLKRYSSRIEFNIVICVNLKYELEYFVRNQDIDVYVIDPAFVYGKYDGLFIAERIKIINHKTNIVFVSNDISSSVLLKIINVEPFGFVSFNDIETGLYRLLDKAIHMSVTDSCLFTYNKRYEKHTVPLRNVIYFTSAHRTIEYICINGESDVFYNKMGDIESTISKLTDDFVRINQSYLINKKYIMHVEGNEVIMMGNHIITVSRKYQKNLAIIRQ